MFEPSKEDIKDLSPEEIIAQHIDWNQQVKDKKLTTEEQKEDFMNNSYLSITC